MARQITLEDIQKAMQSTFSLGPLWEYEQEYSMVNSRRRSSYGASEVTSRSPKTLTRLMSEPDLLEGSLHSEEAAQAEYIESQTDPISPHNGAYDFPYGASDAKDGDIQFSQLSLTSEEQEEETQQSTSRDGTEGEEEADNDFSHDSTQGFRRPYLIEVSLDQSLPIPPPNSETDMNPVSTEVDAAPPLSPRGILFETKQKSTSKLTTCDEIFNFSRKPVPMEDVVGMLPSMEELAKRQCPLQVWHYDVLLSVQLSDIGNYVLDSTKVAGSMEKLQYSGSDAGAGMVVGGQWDEVMGLEPDSATTMSSEQFLEIVQKTQQNFVVANPTVRTLENAVQAIPPPANYEEIFDAKTDTASSAKATTLFTEHQEEIDNNWPRIVEQHISSNIRRQSVADKMLDHMNVLSPSRSSRVNEDFKAFHNLSEDLSRQDSKEITPKASFLVTEDISTPSHQTTRRRSSLNNSKASIIQLTPVNHEEVSGHKEQPIIQTTQEASMNSSVTSPPKSASSSAIKIKTSRGFSTTRTTAAPLIPVEPRVMHSAVLSPIHPQGKSTPIWQPFTSPDDGNNGNRASSPPQKQNDVQAASPPPPVNMMTLPSSVVATTSNVKKSPEAPPSLVPQPPTHPRTSSQPLRDAGHSIGTHPPTATPQTPLRKAVEIVDKPIQEPVKEEPRSIVLERRQSLINSSMRKPLSKKADAPFLFGDFVVTEDNVYGEKDESTKIHPNISNPVDMFIADMMAAPDLTKSMKIRPIANALEMVKSFKGRPPAPIIATPTVQPPPLSPRTPLDDTPSPLNTSSRRLSIIPIVDLDDEKEEEKDDDTFAWGDFTVGKSNVITSHLDDSRRTLPQAGPTFLFGDFEVYIPPTKTDTKKKTRPPVDYDKLRGTIRNYKIRSLGGKSDRIKCVAVDTTEKLFAACTTTDVTVVLTDLKTGVPVHSCIGHKDCISHVAFSPDGKYLATAGRDGLMTLFDVSTSKIYSVHEHPKPVTCVTFSSNGKFVLTGCQDRGARLWATRGKGKKVPTCTFLEHSSFVTCADFQPWTDKVVTGAGDTNVFLWSACTGAITALCSGHSGQILSVGFDNDGKRLFSNDMNEVRVWNTEGLALLVLARKDVLSYRVKPAAPVEFFTVCTFGPAAFPNTLIVCTSDGMMHIFGMEELLNQSQRSRNSSFSSGGGHSMQLIGGSMNSLPIGLKPTLTLDVSSRVFSISSGQKGKVVFGDMVGNVFEVTLIGYNDDTLKAVPETPIKANKTKKVTVIKFK